jgi:hypothetical protein
VIVGFGDYRAELERLAPDAPFDWCRAESLLTGKRVSLGISGDIA